MVKYILWLLVLVPCALAAQQTAQVTYHQATYPIGFLEYLPPNYASGDNFPVLIYLHGGGEVGTGTPESLERIKAWGPPSMIQNGHDMCFEVDGKKECFVVFSPQLYPNIYTWPFIVHQLFDHIFNGPRRYKLDPDRIYLTGMSRGGLGVYQFASNVFNYPNKLAAIAPIAAWAENVNACAISRRNIPLWAFHGEKDTIIPYGLGMSAYNAVQSCANSSTIAEMIFTTYSERYHDSWIPAYDTTNAYHTPNLYQWLLLHKRLDPVTALDEVPVVKNSSIYPNPAHDVIFLSLDAAAPDNFEVIVREVSGQRVRTLQNTMEIDISGLPEGYYSIEVVQHSEMILRSRFIKVGSLR